jgi:hypothetical protein
LLEILLALGLMLLLIAAVSQSMTIFLRLSTLGREETEQAQIARGVLQQFDKDIGSITFTPADKEDFASDDFGGEEVAAEDGFDDGFEDDLDEAAAPPVETGILGTSEELILYINRPDRRMEYVDRDVAVSPLERVGDALTVYYYMCRENGTGVSAEFAREVAPPGLSRDSIGLARMEGDRTTLNKAIAENDTDPQVEASTLLAEEVTSLRFRYYSGGEWLDEWDTMETNSLPQAIEIVISVQIQSQSVRKNDADSSFANTQQQSPTGSEEEEGLVREYRRVVGIPLVPPIELEEL